MGREGEGIEREGKEGWEKGGREEEKGRERRKGKGGEGGKGSVPPLLKS